VEATPDRAVICGLTCCAGSTLNPPRRPSPAGRFSTEHCWLAWWAGGVLPGGNPVFLYYL